MATVLAWGLALGVFASSWCLTQQLRRYAIRRELLDIPNARSSHTVATPRGGGMAIVVCTVVGLPLAALLGGIRWPAVAGAMVGGVLVAGIGFADDHGHVSRRWRLLVHFLAAFIVLALSGGVPPLRISGMVVDLGLPGDVLGMFYIVWLINLTNFMDGIDGLAGTEVILVLLGGAVVSLQAFAGSRDWIVLLVPAAATAGFLIWNWPPARIFMGDAGSGFLGLILAALSLIAASANPTLFWCWLILLGAFVVDATVTLTRRIASGERVYEPHRTHAYQHAARRIGAHKPVTLSVAALNLCWLLPVALLVARDVIGGEAGVLIAYAPIAAAAVWLGAGTKGSGPSSAPV